MKVLVTGAAGMLGHDVMRAASFVNHEVVGFARADLDITDPRAVRRVMEAERPDAVMNCAAWTDVDGAESAESEATEVNGVGAGIVAGEAAAVDALIVHPSSDYVFDGQSRRPYVESDPTAPLSAYGRSKLAGEIEVAAAAERHFIVRSSWLFGVAGRSFPATMLRLAAERDEVAVVTDQVGCPTWTGHLGPALVELAERRGDVGLFHATGAGQCTWYEFAIEIAHRAALPARIVPTTSERFARPARRPAYSVLGTERDPGVALPAWADGLAAYLEERAGTVAA